MLIDMTRLSNKAIDPHVAFQETRTRLKAIYEEYLYISIHFFPSSLSNPYQSSRHKICN
jgi:hypothetical protein